MVMKRCVIVAGADINSYEHMGILPSADGDDGLCPSTPQAF